jgi:hypothetical protein
MNGAPVHSNVEIALFMFPFAALLIMFLFRLDEQFLAAKPRRARRRCKFCEVGQDGRGLLWDPDGRCGEPRVFHRSGGRNEANLTRQSRD